MNAAIQRFETVAAALSPPAAPESALLEGCPTVEQVMSRVQASGIAPDRYLAYADRRWGPGWKLNPHGRARAWSEPDRYRNDVQGYLDKIDSELRQVSS